VDVSEVHIAASPQYLQHIPDQLVGSDLTLAFIKASDACKLTEEKTIKNMYNLLV
jgi:hypothetical protein